MSTGLTANCCTPQVLSVNNATGYLSISDGNSVYLGTMIKALGIKTPVVNFVLNGFLVTLTYTDVNGNIQNSNIDLSGLAQGGSFVANNTPSIDLTYAAGNLDADVNVSAQAGNSLIINPDGLYAPTTNQQPLVANNSTTVTLVSSGINNMTLLANVNISANPSNKIQVATDGLLVQDMTTYILQGNGISFGGGNGTATSPYIISATASTQTPLSVSDTNSLHLVSSGTNGMSLTGSVKISALSANALILNSDGLYVPQSSTATYTNAQARLALSVTAPLTYNNQTGVFGITQATSSASGYLANNDWNTFNSKISTGASIGSSSSVAVYAGQNGNTLNFNGLRAGTNVTINQVGNDIVINSAGTGGGGTVSSVFNLDFIIGDGGAFTPTANASQFNPTSNPLAGRTILGFFIEGIKTAGVPRSNSEVYFTFTQSTGALTLTNGVFSSDTYYSILYK